MKTYPSIDWKTRTGSSSVYVFPKYDGSNIRAEWSRKKGFWKFGRRNGLLDHSNPTLLTAPDLILNVHGDTLGRIFTAQRWQKAVAFFEFWGPRSFAGNHEDEPHQCTLIDVACDTKGIREPKEFVRLFTGDDVAPVLHHGAFDREMEEQVRSGMFPGQTFEGVVCKGGYASPGLPMMFKVKSQAWLDRLRNRCGDDDALFERLR